MPYSDSERKRLLIAQAAVFRLGVTTSRDQVRAELHPQALIQAALRQVTGNVGAVAVGMFSLEALRRGNFKLLLPVLQAGLALLPKKRLLRAIASKRMLMAGGVVAAVALCVYALRRKKPAAARRTDAGSRTQ
jgi:hypothetical protein